MFSECLGIDSNGVTVANAKMFPACKALKKRKKNIFLFVYTLIAIGDLLAFFFQFLQSTCGLRKKPKQKS